MRRKIPKNAKRVFKGEIFEVYQWPQKMFDGSRSTFEMIKRPDTVQILPVVDGKILLAYEKQPRGKFTYGMFGGRVEPGEAPLQTARRELLEETGRRAARWRLLKVYEPHSKIEWKVYFYVASGCERVQPPRLDVGEKIKIRPVSFARFVVIATAPEFRAPELAAELLRLKLEGRMRQFEKKLWSTRK